MYSALQRMNVPTRLLIWPDENHWILKGENSRVFYREVRAWLEKYLLPASPPTAAAWSMTTNERPLRRRPEPIKDDGLRRVLTWTFIALVVSLLMTLIGVTLAIRWFDRP